MSIIELTKTNTCVLGEVRRGSAKRKKKTMHRAEFRFPWESRPQGRSREFVPPHQKRPTSRLPPPTSPPSNPKIKTQQDSAIRLSVCLFVCPSVRLCVWVYARRSHIAKKNSSRPRSPWTRQSAILKMSLTLRTFTPEPWRGCARTAEAGRVWFGLVRFDLFDLEKYKNTRSRRYGVIRTIYWAGGITWVQRADRGSVRKTRQEQSRETNRISCMKTAVQVAPVGNSSTLTHTTAVQVAPWKLKHTHTHTLKVTQPRSAPPL